MNASQRRKEILELLHLDIKPMSASNLAERFGVSRQVIVGDIALLRASGTEITATARGYILDKANSDSNDLLDTYVLACRHDKVMLEDELHSIVDNGAQLLNITVEHPVYGNITQDLNIGSRFEAGKFVSSVAVTGSQLLCFLTGGVHFHTIRCKDPEAYRRILISLKDKGILHT